MSLGWLVIKERGTSHYTSSWLLARRNLTVPIRIHHVQVAIPSGGAARARAFYGGLLGLEEVTKPANLQGRGGLWYQAGNLQLHLGVDRAFRPAEKAHVAFQVVGLAALRRRLDAAGHATSEDEPLPGYDRCYVNDPFGNRTELVEPR
jgi:catechol 2,3-dioxygenase-like lactoylglutathione lyase family enzyme